MDSLRPGTQVLVMYSSIGLDKIMWGYLPTRKYVEKELFWQEGLFSLCKIGYTAVLSFASSPIH